MLNWKNLLGSDKHIKGMINLIFTILNSHDYLSIAMFKGRIISKPFPILEAPSNSDHIKALNFLCEIKFKQENRALLWSELEGASKIGTSFEIILPLIMVVLI